MKKITLAIILSVFSITAIFPSLLDDLQVKPLNADRLKLFPVPDDGRNYFFLQSIDDRTQIVIGDFTQTDKKIILINLKSDYNTIDSVIEYYPQQKSTRVRRESESKFFTTDMAKLKRDIISGAVFKNNNTDLMKSYDVLESVFKKNESENVLPETYGFSVRFSETDIRKPAAMFSFGKAINGYYLIFKTEYFRKNVVTETIPVLKYSVYCRDTHDPLIQETVENLFKIRAPFSSNIK